MFFWYRQTKIPKIKLVFQNQFENIYNQIRKLGLLKPFSSFSKHFLNFQELQPSNFFSYSTTYIIYIHNDIYIYIYIDIHDAHKCGDNRESTFFLGFHTYFLLLNWSLLVEIRRSITPKAIEQIFLV